MKQQGTGGKTQGPAGSWLAGENTGNRAGPTRLNAGQVWREKQAEEEYMNTGGKTQGKQKTKNTMSTVQPIKATQIT